MLPRMEMSLLLTLLGKRTGSPLRSERLVLVSPNRSHYNEWAELRGRSRQHLEPFEPQWSHDELSRAAYRRRLRRYAFERREGAGFAFFIFRSSDAAMVGGMTLSGVRRGVTQSASVGYWIGRPFIRQGYATEALRTVSQFAFENLRLHRVDAACMPRNAGSIAVLGGGGFRQEGLARRFLKINGRWEDHLLFARLADEKSGAGARPGRFPMEFQSQWRRPEVLPGGERQIDIPMVARVRDCEGPIA
ncbi:MAG: GNAT family N-acetyltransferase [Hyphomicrobiaceae bacterium]